MIKTDADLVKCEIAIQLGMAKPSIRLGIPSFNSSGSVVMSPLLSQDWQLKGDRGMQCVNCIGWNCGNEGNLITEEEKRLYSPKYRTESVYFCCY